MGVEIGEVGADQPRIERGLDIGDDALADPRHQHGLGVVGHPLDQRERERGAGRAASSSEESRAMKMRSSTGCISQARSAVLPPAIAMQTNASAIRCQCRQMKSRTSRPMSTDERAPCCGIRVLSRIGLPPPVLEAGRVIGKAGCQD